MALCDPASLVASAVGFDRLSERELTVVQTYLLAQLLTALNGAAVDAKTLVAAAVSYEAISGDHAAVHDYLLCQIATASGA